MPNMEELLYQISVHITRDRTVQLFMSKINLDYAYSQMKLSEETSRQCVFAITGEYSTDTTDSKRDLTVLPTYPQNSKKKLTGHLNTVHRHGWMT